MYGKVIGTSIAVDCFQEVTKNGIYFLTEGQLINPVPNHVDRIYTSTYNAWLLSSRFQMDPDKIVGLPTDEKLLIQDKIKGLHFFVTLMDAKQKPGAVMFLFEGENLGSILYAGKCCHNDHFSPPLSNFLQSKVIDYLYIHDVCDDCHNHSMSTSAAVEDIVNIMKWNPKRKVIINEPYFREDILKCLGNILKKKICVSENIMKHLEEVGQGSHFTLEKSKAQVFVTDKHHDKMNSYGHPVFKIILIPCSMKRSPQEIQLKLEKLEKKGYHTILYRNHCSPPELLSLVKSINARHTVLIRPSSQISHLSERKKDLDFWSHLGNVQRFIEFLDNFQYENNDEPELPIEMDDNGVSDAELQNAVECIVESKDQENESNNNVSLEAPSPNSFILIDSDIESIPSQDRETVLNAQIT